MAAVPNNNIPTQNTMLPDHFNVFKGGTKFTCDEAVMKEQITTILGPYGVKKLSLGPGAHSNPNENTKQKFPHKRGSGYVAAVKRKPRKRMILNQAAVVSK